MPRRQGPGLSLAEWLVLCLVSQEPAHCFALAALLAPRGSVGMAWHVRKAVVYRAAQRLERLGLITAEGKQYSSQGPPRARLSATPEGHRAARAWLSEPVSHARDVRSELLLKLALLSRSGADPGDLLRAQRRQFALAADQLATQAAAATGSDLALALWRRESVGATLRFLDTLLAPVLPAAGRVGRRLGILARRATRGGKPCRTCLSWRRWTN